MVIDSIIKKSLVDDICRFVQIPSRSSPKGGEEGELQLLVARRMREIGARVRVFEVEDIPEFRKHPLCHGSDRQYKNRPTVVGELGPRDAPALLILAHSDTVQITNPDDWTFNPFCGELCNGKICGLGASDDKWGIATMLVIMRLMAESGQPLKKKLIFASTIDEENGIGNGTLLLMLAGIKAEAAFYLDGFGMSVFLGNLGGSFLYLRPKDQVNKDQISQHGSLLESACQEFNSHRASMFDQPFFEDNARRKKSNILINGSDDEGPLFTWAFYTLPGEKKSAFCEELESVIFKALGDKLSNYKLSYCEPWFEPGLTSIETPLVGYLADSIRDIIGKKALVTTITKQDRFVLTNYAGIPTVSFGPKSAYSEISGRGANHQPDEYIEIEEAWQGCQIAYSTVCRWLEEQQ